jgi:nicotinamidase-related amidase
VEKMEALLMIDITEDLIKEKETLKRIHKIVTDFKLVGKPVIHLSHLHPIQSTLSEWSDSLLNEANYVFNQRTPSCYFNTELSAALETLKIDHLYLIGNNKDSCCRYIASSARDKGYKVTFCESGFGQLSHYDTYEMKGLDFFGLREQDIS